MSFGEQYPGYLSSLLSPCRSLARIDRSPRPQSLDACMRPSINRFVDCSHRSGASCFQAGPTCEEQTRPLSQTLQALNQCSQHQKNEPDEYQPEGNARENRNCDELGQDPKHSEDYRNPPGDDFRFTEFHVSISFLRSQIGRVPLAPWSERPVVGNAEKECSWSVLRPLRISDLHQLHQRTCAEVVWPVLRYLSLGFRRILAEVSLLRLYPGQFSLWGIWISPRYFRHWVPSGKFQQIGELCAYFFNPKGFDGFPALIWQGQPFFNPFLCPIRPHDIPPC